MTDEELLDRYRRLSPIEQAQLDLYIDLLTAEQAGGTDIAPNPDDIARRYYLSGNRLTVDEAAYLVGVNPRTIRRWIAAGHITALTIGGKLMIDRQPLIDYAANHTHGKAIIL